jgi:hypothetical protein
VLCSSSRTPISSGVVASVMPSPFVQRRRRTARVQGSTRGGTGRCDGATCHRFRGCAGVRRPSGRLTPAALCRAREKPLSSAGRLAAALRVTGRRRRRASPPRTSPGVLAAPMAARSAGNLPTG